MHRLNTDQPGRGHASGHRSWTWTLAAVLAAAALPAYAADYTDGVTVSGSTATLWFKSNVNTSWVDVHYLVNGGGTQNVRMQLSTANNRYEQALTGVAAGTQIKFNFTYNNGNPAFDSPQETYTVSGTTTPPPPPPPPASGGIACFYADVNYTGASFCTSSDSSWIGSDWNDRISSVKVTAGNKVVLFNDINYGGSSLTLTGDNPNLVSSNFNDLTSSYKINPSSSNIPTSDNPDFGPNVHIFDPSTSQSTLQGAVDAAFNQLKLSPTAQFGASRWAFLFKPGANNSAANYVLNANVGFYMALAGLGQHPDDVTITGSVNVDSGWNLGDEQNATQNFWRSVENLAIAPNGGVDRWAVSQAAPMRRVHVRGDLVLGPSNQGNPTGYASGGYISDTKIDGLIASGSQQQWYTRDSTLGKTWYDGVWNMVFSGVRNAPAQSFPTPPYTTLASTPVSREKPYLYYDSAANKYAVFVPALRQNAVGTTWEGGSTAGTSIPMSKFYVAKPGDSAATINAALSQGLNVFFTPGVYALNDTIRVTQANTVLMGIGFPTLQPNNGVDALQIADVDGVKVAGLLFDAGTTNSTNLLQVGPAGSSASHAGNPTSIQDTYFRVGGGVSGKATNSIVVNSSNVLIDHIWAWRADHGSAPTGWTVNTGDNGLVVNGNDVLATGLFVEHYQKYNVLWNGQRGRTIFFQNELPYDPPSQAAWRADATGYPAYKVADNVTTHEAWGVGSYCFFNANPNIHASHGFEVPVTPGVKFHDALTVSLGGVGVIDHVINDTGAAAQGTATQPVNVVDF